MQPGGNVLGFPAEWSRALRLSPFVCIVDTLGVLFSICFFYYRTGSIKDGFSLAARYRCLTEDDPVLQDRSGVIRRHPAEPKLERTWWFRSSVFALGALPQAVKLLGMGGIPLTKTWGAAYLVSFLVIEGLDLLQPRQHGDDRVLEQHAPVLDKYICPSGCLAVFAQAFCFTVEVYLISTAYPDYQHLQPRDFLPPLEPGNVTNTMTTLIKITPYWLLLLLSPFVLNRAISVLFERIPGCSLDDSEVFQMGVVLGFAPIYLVQLGSILNGLGSMATALALLLTSFIWVLIWTERASKFRWFRKLFGMERYERREGSFPLTFTAANIAGIICYYMYIYNPCSTYKPPWTGFWG